MPRLDKLRKQLKALAAGLPSRSNSLRLRLANAIAPEMTAAAPAEDELGTAHDGLEGLMQRTAELACLNAGLLREASERSLIEVALRQSDLRHREILDTASDQIYRISPTGHFTFVNPSAAQLVKRSVEECLGLHFLALLVEDYRAEAAAFYKEQVVSKTAITYYEFPVLAKDGSVIWLGQNLQLVIQDGRIVELQGIARDITGRKAIEQQLSDSERHYRVLFEANPKPMWVYDLETLGFLAVNRAAIRHYGFTQEEFLELTLRDISPWEDITPLLHPPINEARIWKHRKKDGTLIDVEITADRLEFHGRAAKLVAAFDVTAHKEAEKDLQFQKARFQQLFENTPMGIVSVDQNDSVLDANSAFEALFQLSLHDIRALPINDAIVPPALIDEARALSAATNQGEITACETVRQRKDGRLVPVQCYGVPILVNQKQVGAFAVYVDLSARMRLEAERRAVFDFIQGAIYTSDLDQLFKLAHKSIGELLYAENCFVALHDPVTALMHYEFWIDKYDPRPAPEPVSSNFGSHVLRTGEPLLLNRQLTDEWVRRGRGEKSGASSASWLGVPLRTHARTIGVLVVQHYEDENAYQASDQDFLMSVGSQIGLAIERKQSELALQSANRGALVKYEHLIERIASLAQTLGNAHDLSIIFRALREFACASAPCEGIVISFYEKEKRSRKIVYCWADNKELDLELPVDVPVGQGATGRAISTGTIIIDNDYKPMVGNGKPVLLGEYAEEGTPRSALIVPMTVMGRTVGCVELQSNQLNQYVQEHAEAMRMAGNLAANAVENVILMERKQEHEAQLRQAQKMESLGTLAGGVAHDFNNLMTAVTGYSELALRSLGPDDKIRSKLEVIKSAGERASGLTRQLLAFSRKQMLQPKVLELNQVITAIGKMLPRVIGEHIDLRYRLDRSLGQIKADPGQVEQVIMNLAVNARDSMPHGGSVMIKTENVHLTRRLSRGELIVEPGHYVMMSVSDTGSGMDADTQAHIFEPFFTTKDVGKGTGLGLSTVYGIVKQSGGSLWLYSEVGKGTTFKLYFPRVDEAVPSEDAEALTVVRGKETILLVEDEDVVRTLAREILEGYGYSVLVAANGREGLRIGSEYQTRIDLVITDVIMPQMNGPEMVGKMKDSRPDTRVLFMSGFTDDAIVHHGVLDDTVFFIQKPFSPDALANKTREVLDAHACY